MPARGAFVIALLVVSLDVELAQVLVVRQSLVNRQSRVIYPRGASFRRLQHVLLHHVRSHISHLKHETIIRYEPQPIKIKMNWIFNTDQMKWSHR